MNQVIISAKLKKPIPRKNYVVRHELFCKLLTMDEYNLIVIEGGAGSGKTTLMSSFIDAYQLDMKWLTLDRNFNDVFLFFQYFVEMFHDEINQSAYNRLFEECMMKEGLYQVVQMLCQDLQSLNQQYIVLDNVHYIADEFLCELLDMLLEQLPQDIHIIMLGRSLPQIHLGKLYANHQVLTISEVELAMDDEEAKQFLIKTLQINYDEKIIQSAHGWVAALQLLSSFSMELHDEVMQMDILEDYIEKEFLKEWDPHIIEFMQLTAVLNYFDEDLCQYICPHISFGNTIQFLMHHHILLIQLDEHVYTYHDLIKDYFTKKFDLKEKDYKSNYLIKVASYYESINEYDECLKYLLWNQDYEKMMNLLVKLPQNGKTLAYLTKVPIHEIIKNADFAIQYFFYFYVNSDEQTCFKIYQLTRSYIQDHPFFTVFENMNLFVDDRKKTRYYPMTSLQQLLQLQLSEVTLAIVLIKDTFLLYLSDYIEEAKEYLAKADEFIQRHPHDYLKYFYYITCAQFYEYTGELEKSIHYFKQAQPYLRCSPHLGASYYIGIAGVYIKQLRIMEAQNCFKLLEHRMDSEPKRIHVAYNQTYIQLLYLLEKGEEAIQTCELLFESCQPNEIIYLGHLLQMQYSCHKKHYIFDLFEKEYLHTIEKERDSDAHILYALIAYHHQRIEEARCLLEQTLAYTRKKGLRLNLTEINLYLILYFHQYYSSRQIVNLWKEAVHYIVKEHIDLPFWLIRYDIHKFAEVCQKYHLLQCISMEEKTRIQLYLPASPLLTAREQEVMKLLQKGYTNKQVADTLCVSLSTVKTHLINIFSKLQVNNRIEAITKYQEMYE